MFLLKKLLLIFVLISFVYSEIDIGKLPHCSKNSAPGLVLVSTIDGKFSALDSEGALKWQLETGNSPLLTSNIHNLELTNNGKWMRIIPSLTGSLYTFDGKYIDPIQITAESLLKSSFKYSDDCVIGGGLELTTYGVGFRSGKVLYTCSSLGCINATADNDNDVDDILIVERSTQTVRAIETLTGHERWNFSVGHHNIKLPQITCSHYHPNLANWNVTAIIPDGLLLSSQFFDNVQKIWQYKFTSPIVRIWKWNGIELTEIDLFSLRSDREPSDTHISPSIYLGMHKKQLYIHESYAMQRKTQNGVAIHQAGSLGKIPWKPISASGLLTEKDATAISILYSSDYVNGHGYYLFSSDDLNKKNGGLCKNNNTLKLPGLTDESGILSIYSLLGYWKEILVILLTTSVVFNIMFRSLTRHQQQSEQKVIFVERHVTTDSRSSSDRVSESSDSVFISRYTSDFDTLTCLGKGGFGVVFEVKQKIDECHYAIKRTVLPNEESKRETVMREVKALAKLEHRNIVRYFNSWVEKPPYGWQQQHDNEFIRENYEFSESVTSHNNTMSNKYESSDVKIGFDSDNMDYLINNKSATDNDDSFIVFNGSSTNNQNTSIEFDDNSNKTDIVSCDGSPVSTGTVNWKRPSRRYHSLNHLKNPENPPVFLYIQMQLCQKQSLREWLVENKNREFDSILDIFKQIVSAVEYVHMQGLIHRDLKPSNIFFSLDGQIKVGDFGLVKDVDESYDLPSTFSPMRRHTKEVGTRLYMSPEQIDGKKYNYKVDIYSLGLIFFELLVHFSTDMERIRTLTDLRDNNYPKDFINRYNQEYQLLKMMLCQLPEKRLTTFGIRARAPINSCDENYSEAYDFELPKCSTKKISI